MRVITRVVVAFGLLSFALNGESARKKEGPAVAPLSSEVPAIFLKYGDFKWDKILPDLGADSPENCILHTNPATHATQLMIRTPRAIHVRKHWHSANETHTMISGTATFACDEKRIELGPGSFQFMPARMVHEAWLPVGSITFITVDAAWDLNWVEGAPTAADLMR
jgi:mannose-6-phosphate isomerase-like protein (cupin superfamily)